MRRLATKQKSEYKQDLYFLIARKMMSTTKKTIISAMFLAIALILNQVLRFEIPIGGASMLRISTSGPFLRFVGILFGPLYGGIIAALSDVMSFFISNRSGAGFLWPLTVVAFCRGAVTAFLWHKVKRINFKIVSILYLFMFGMIVLVGIVNQTYVSFFPYNQYTQFILGANNNVGFFTWGAILIGSVGIVLHVGAFKIFKKLDKQENFSLYLRLMSCVLLPGLFFTTVNTWLLVELLSLQMGFIFFWVPRMVNEVFSVIFTVYVLILLINLYKRIFSIDLVEQKS